MMFSKHLVKVTAIQKEPEKTFVTHINPGMVVRVGDNGDGTCLIRMADGKPLLVKGKEREVLKCLGFQY